MLGRHCSNGDNLKPAIKKSYIMGIWCIYKHTCMRTDTCILIITIEVVFITGKCIHRDIDPMLF